ncbi:MAG: sulfotransferase, partial [Geminicoccaceae bacterium]|nr:sulfotransferase [Geminicoccaceae bacterium]
MSRPNFLVIGAQRAGTTLLHTILDAHPEVYVPRARKEIHYFDRYHDRGPDWYASYFNDARTVRFRAIGEVT